MAARVEPTSVLLLVGMALFLTAFVSPGWRSVDVLIARRWDGLWHNCLLQSQSDDHKYLAVQVLMSCALACFVIAVALLFVKLCGSPGDEKRAQIGLICVLFLAVLFIAIGLVLYGADYGKSVNWSYGLAAASAGLCLVAGIVAAVQLHR